MRSTFHEANRQALVGCAVAARADPMRVELMFDPQTCGPMLLGLSEPDAARLVAETGAVVIGRVRDAIPAGTLALQP